MSCHQTGSIVGEEYKKIFKNNGKNYHLVENWTEFSEPVLLIPGFHPWKLEGFQMESVSSQLNGELCKLNTFKMYNE